MSRVCFSFRFIIDRHFFDKVMKNNHKVFMALMYISSCSAEYKREHNLMSNKIRQDLIEKNPDYSPEYIKSSLNKISEPEEIEAIDDELVRNIKYAVHYTKVSPEKVTPICILTSDDMKQQYLNSSHMEDIKNVIIKSGSEAIALLEEYKQSAWDT
jgi:hypothetical protein